MKNLKTFFSETILDYQDEVTLKKVIKELGITILLSTIVVLLGIKLVYAPLTLLVNPTMAMIGLSIGGVLGVATNIGLTISDLKKTNKYNKEAKQEINDIILDLRSKGLEYTKKDLKNAKVVEIRSDKDIVNINGKETKRHRIVNYIIIEDKKKLTIIKELIKDIKLYDDIIVDSVILEKEDLIKEGLTNKYGFYTEKGKTLILNKK